MKNKAATALKMISRLVITVLISSALSAPPAWPEGTVDGFREYEYWDNGNMKVCKLIDSAGRVKAKAILRYDGTLEKIERFDDYGNKTELALYSDRGKMKTGIDGWAAMRWWYEDNRIRQQVSYDENGRPIERKIYSEGGRLLYRQFNEDAKVDPYEEASMYILLGGANIPYRDNAPGN